MLKSYTGDDVVFMAHSAHASNICREVDKNAKDMKSSSVTRYIRPCFDLLATGSPEDGLSVRSAQI